MNQSSASGEEKQLDLTTVAHILIPTSSSSSSTASGMNSSGIPSASTLITFELAPSPSSFIEGLMSTIRGTRFWESTWPVDVFTSMNSRSCTIPAGVRRAVVSCWAPQDFIGTSGDYVQNNGSGLKPKFDSHRTRLCKYTSGLERRFLFPGVWEDDGEGRESAAASWDTRKYLRRKLMNPSTSSVVDDAPNDIRATPSGLAPFSPPNSSMNGVISQY